MAKANQNNKASLYAVIENRRTASGLPALLENIYVISGTSNDGANVCSFFLAEDTEGHSYLLTANGHEVGTFKRLSDWTDADYAWAPTSLYYSNDRGLAPGVPLTIRKGSPKITATTSALEQEQNRAASGPEAHAVVATRTIETLTRQGGGTLPSHDWTKIVIRQALSAAWDTITDEEITAALATVRYVVPSNDGDAKAKSKSKGKAKAK